MRCEECRTALEEFYDGELPERAMERVAAHIATCEACARAYQKFRREQQLFLSYECDAEAAPTFWSEVLEKSACVTRPRPAPAARLRQRVAGLLDASGAFNAPRFSPAVVALFILLAVGLTAGVMKFVGSGDKMGEQARVFQVRNDADNGKTAQPLPSQTQIAAPPPSTVNYASRESRTDEENDKRIITRQHVEKKGREMLASNDQRAHPPQRKIENSRRATVADELVREAEQKYLAAIALLARDVNRRSTPLDAATASRFKQTLAAVDRTIAGTRRAVKEHPADPVAVQYMLTAYAKKVEVMREMASY